MLLPGTHLHILRLCLPSLSSLLFLVCRTPRRWRQSPVGLAHCMCLPASLREGVAVQRSFLISVGDHSRFLLLLQLPLTGHPTFYFEETKLVKHETPISNQLSFFLHTCLYKHPLILPSISDVIACSHNFLITVLISSFP